MASSSPKITNKRDERQPRPNKSRKQLRVLIVNFQSVKNKRNDLQIMLDSSQPDVILGTETWLSDKINTSEIFPPELGYDVIRRDRKGDPHGGVLIAAKTDLGLSHLQTSTETELIAGTITIGPKKKAVISCLYRPPNRSDQQYSDKAIQDITKLRPRNKKDTFILGGDFNLPDIEWESYTINGTQNQRDLNNSYLQMAANLNIQQIVDKPTRGEKTLDLLFTSHPGQLNRCKTLPPLGNSDHDIVLTDLATYISRAKPTKRKIHLWKKADISGINNYLSEQLSNFKSTNYENINTMWRKVKEIILEAINQHVPTRQTLAKHTHPWMNSDLRRLTNKKQKAYTKAKQSGKPRDMRRYRAIKAELQRESRRTHNRYMEDIVSEDLQKNPKKFWSYVKSRKQDSSQIVTLKSKDGFLHSDTTNKASILNQQFQSVYTKEDLQNLPDLGTSPFPPMDNITVNERGIFKLLKGLRPFKATGPDEVPAFILKSAADTIAPYLTRVFQLSLDQGKIPDEWRSANIVPIHKKGEKHQPANYRPISLTSIACKLLEHVMHSTVMDHFDEHNILCEEQHGFRTRRSCETQLILTFDKIARNIDQGFQTDIILLDFSKAFDKVPHQRLLLKLAHYGVRGRTLEWIKDFLSNRTQSVVLEGQSSSPLDVLSGVPQGTVLGPLLFLAYINDIPDCTTSDARLFADDCLVYREIRNKADASKLQNDLTSLEAWEQKWQMCFHPEKCIVIRITNKRQPLQTQYQLHGHQLEVVDSGKYLGVTISHDLQWTKHISSTIGKATRTLGFLRRNLGRCKPSVKASAYCTLIRPSIEYASSVWDPHQSTLTKEIEQVQRRAARFVFNQYTDTSPGCVTSLLEQLEWESLQDRRAQHRLIMCYKIRHKLVDIDPDLYYTPGDSRTRGGHRYRQHRATKEVYNNSFFPRSVREWNHLPETVTAAPTLEEFRARIAGGSCSQPPQH